MSSSGIPRPNIDITSTLRNPGEQFSVSAHDGPFPTSAFDQAEADLFNQQLMDLIADIPSSTVAEVLEQRQETIAKAASLAKHDLEIKNFGGINAGDNEMGFSILRPGHIRRASTNDPANAAGTIVNDWYFNPDDAPGWVDWIGDGGTNNFAVDDDQVILVLGFIDQEAAPSEISGVNVDTFGRNMDMLPRGINSLRLQDNETGVQIQQMQTLIGQEQDEVHARLRYDRSVERQPRLLGFTFGLGRFLNLEDYAETDYTNLP